jgi:multiple sugar transport system permease protein
MAEQKTKTKRKKLQSMEWKNAWRLHRDKYLLILPFALIFCVFTVLPVAVSMVLSLTNFNMLQVPDFIGLKNYIDLFVTDSVFGIAVKNTLFFAIVTGPVSYLMCFVFAWVINELPPKVRAFMTLVFYAPSISGNAFVIWKLLFSSDMYGYINAYLLKWNIISSPILWFETAEYIMPILIIVQLWLSLGVGFLSFVAGLQSQDAALYEAGAIDGIKNRWQELWYITLPSMKPQLMFGAVTQITSSFGVASISEQLAGFPSVDYAGHFILNHLNDYGTLRYEMGYASAIACVLFFIMIFANILVQKVIRKVGS